MLLISLLLNLTACDGQKPAAGDAAGNELQQIMTERGLTEDDVLAAAKTFTPRGKTDDYVIFASLLFYFFTVLALFRLRATRPELPRPVKAFAYPVGPALYMVAVAALMVILLFKKPLYTWPGLLIVALGVPIYFLWRRDRRG